MHSKYARATSTSMDLEHVAQGARLKGLNIVGTGDFSHPSWFNELKKKLVESDALGFYELRNPPALASAGGAGGVGARTNENQKTLFCLTNEVSTIISTREGVKKVHHVLHAPSFEEVAQLNDVYSKLGDLKADGRPTFGNCSPAEIVEKTLEVTKNAVIIPAHAWTPWFSVFGSMSGFNSLDEAFEDQSKNIFAIETGMSSDPAMNWRISALDKISLVSNSDSHSYHPWRIGRECNVFEFSEKELSFENVFKAVREKNARHFKFTVEVDPNYGKYHYDGHRSCNFSCPPDETKKLGGVCPVCKRRLTVGVLNRVEQLADRPKGFTPKNAIPFKTLLPLHELLATVFSSTLASKRVMETGDKLIREFGSEFGVLLNAQREELLKHAQEKVVDVIIANREGKLKVKPGFDGEYGILMLDSGRTVEEETKQTKELRKQKTLDEY